MSPAANLPPGEPNQLTKPPVPRIASPPNTPSASQAAVGGGEERATPNELSSDPPCGRLRHGPTNEGDRWELPEVVSPGEDNRGDDDGQDKRYR